MVTIGQIRSARNKKALNWLEKRARMERDQVVNNPHIKSKIKSRARRDYSKKIKAIRVMRRKVKN